MMCSYSCIIRNQLKSALKKGIFRDFHVYMIKKEIWADSNFMALCNKHKILSYNDEIQVHFWGSMHEFLLLKLLNAVI